MIGFPTIDQLRVFIAVAEAGSFSAAARRLNRAQSVVSYAIANLEEQLGAIALFDRSSHRPVLTDAGKALLADAREIALTVDTMRARARGLTAGLEGEVSIVVDVMLPSAVIVDALHALRAAYPTVSLRLYVEALGAVAERVLSGQCAIGISGPLPNLPDRLTITPVGSVELIPVAAPSHPLARHDGPITAELARRHVQLVLTDRSDLTSGQDVGVLGLENWRLGDLGAKHTLLRAGLGWGNMPRAMVSEDLAAGRLVELSVPLFSGVDYRLSAISRTDLPPGPVGCWLTDRIRELLHPGNTGLDTAAASPL